MLQLSQKNIPSPSKLALNLDFDNQTFTQGCLSPIFITDINSHIPSFNSLAFFEPNICSKRSSSFDLDNFFKKKVKPNPGAKKTDIPPLKLKEPDPTSQKPPPKNSNQPLNKMNQKPAPATSKDQTNKENPTKLPELRAQAGPGIKPKNKPHKIFKVIRDSNQGLLYKPVQTKNNKQIKIQAPKIDDIISFFMDKVQQEQPSQPIDLEDEVSKFQEKKTVFLQSLSSEFLYPPNLKIPEFVVSNSSQINGEKIILPSINIPQYVESIYREFKLEIEEKAKEFKKANINNDSSLSTTAVNSIKSESMSLESDVSPSRHDVDLSAIVTPFGVKKDPEPVRKEEKQAKVVKKIFSIKSEPPRFERLEKPEKLEKIITPTMKEEQTASFNESPKINRKDLKVVVEKALEEIKSEKIIKKSKSERVSPKAIQKEAKKNKKKLKRKTRKPFVSKWDVTSNRRLNKWQKVQTDKDDDSKPRLEESRPAIRPTRKAKTRVENFKKIPVGSNYQVQIPPLEFKKVKAKTSSRGLKVLWEPENMKKKSLEYYFKKLQETYGFYPNEQKAIKLLRENGYELKKVWKEVDGKEAEYSRLFRLKLTRDRGLYFY